MYWLVDLVSVESLSDVSWRVSCIGKGKNGWDGGKSCPCCFFVLKLDICPVACKRRQIIFKRKRKKSNQSTSGVIILHAVVEEFRVRAATLPSCCQNSTEKKNEEILLDPKVRHWIGLTRVSTCANSLVSPTFVPTTDAVLSLRDYLVSVQKMVFPDPFFQAVM